MKITSMRKALFLSIAFLLFSFVKAQDLTISTSGQQGTSGTNWSISGNTLTIAASGSANVHPNVISEHLLNIGDLTVILPPQSLVARDVHINSNITYGGSLPRTLTFNSANDIRVNPNVMISSTQAALNIVFRSGMGSNPDSGRIRLDQCDFNTNGGHFWAGGGSIDATWNGLTVGSSYARTWSDDVAGIVLASGSITTSGGSIYMNGYSHESGDIDGTNYGVHIDNSSLTAGAGNITLIGSLNGRYTNGYGVRIVATTSTAAITTTTGAISISSTATDYATNGNSWRMGTYLYSTSPTNNTTVSSTTGNISISGAANFTATINDKEGVVLAGNGLVITSQTGDITITGTNSLQTSGQYCNSIRFGPTNATDAIRIGYDGTNVYSGNIIIEGNSIYQRNFNSGSGSISIQSTGSLTIRPTGDAFTHMRAGDSGTLTFDDDWNFGTTLSAFTYGKTTNTMALSYASALSVAGPITFYSGNFTANQNITSTVTGSPILLQSTGSITLASNKTIQAAGGSITLKATATGTASSASAIVLNTGSSLLSQGGNITLGGGFTGQQGAGLYAVANNAPAVLIDGATLSAAGGHLKIYGKCNTSYDDGIRIRGIINTTGAGNIELYGEAYGGNNGTNYFGGITFGTSAGSTLETENGNLVLNGYLTNTQSNSTGAINFYREDGLTGQTKHINLLSKTGNITVTADIGTTGAYGIGHSSWGNVYVGSPSNNSWTATGNVVFTYARLVGAGYNGIKVKTSGAVSYLPTGTSFTAAQVLPSNSNYILADGASSLTIGSSTNTANINIASALSIAGPIAIYGGLLEIQNDIASTAGADITLSGSNGFYTSGSSAIQRDITTSGGNILIEADRDANGSGTLNLDYLVANPGTGNTIIRGEDYNWVTTSESTKPWINGTGTFTLESNDASIGQELWMQWFKLDQDANGIGGLTIGKTTNAHHVYFNSVGALTVNGPVQVNGYNIGFQTLLTIPNHTLSIRAIGSVSQSTAIIANGLSLNGTGTYTLTHTGNNFQTFAAGAVGSLPGAIEVIDATGSLTIGTIGSQVGITNAGTVKVETLASNLTLEANIYTTSTSTNAVILTAAKNTAIGVGTGGDILISGSPTITMGTGGIAKLFSGLEATSTGLTTFVGGAANVRSNYDETTVTFSPVLAANNAYAIYRTLPSVGNLTIVSSGGHAINSTWEYANGIISTISTPVLINASVIESYLSSGPLTINSGSITFNAEINNPTTNAFTCTGASTATNNAIATLASTITSAGNITINSREISINENITVTGSAAISLSAITNISSNPTVRRTLLTSGGNITLTADSDANGSGQLNIDYLTFNPGSGTTTLRGETFSFDTGTAGPYINGTGAFVLEPADAAFGQDVYTSWFTFDQDNNGINAINVGKLGNTANIFFDGHVTVGGPINIYGGEVDVTGNLTSTANGDIFIKGIYGWNDIEITSTITKTAGTGTLTLQSNGRAHMGGAISATGTAILNVVFWSDYDGDNSDGGSTFFGAISTNGGHVWMGGSNTNGGSYTWNGLTVGDGPSVGGSNANALDFFNSVTTNGGDVFVWAGNGNGGTNGIASNGNWTINSGSGDIALVAPSTSGTIQLTTTGAISLVPNGGAYPAALTLGGTLTSGNYTFNTGFYSGLVINNVSQVASLTFGRNADLLTAGTPYVLGNSSGLTLSSALQFGGAVQLYAGTITLNSNLSTTNTSTGNISLNGTTIAGTGNISIAEGRTLTMNVTNTSTYDGIISGTGSGFTKAGLGLLTLTKDHTFSGIATVSTGDLQIGTGGSVSQASSGTISQTSGVVVASGAKLILTPNENMTFAAPISGAGGIEIKGASGAYYNSFLTGTYATIATNTTVLEVLTRITGGMQQGQAITGQKTAGAYVKSYNASSNTATLQLQNYDGTYTKCVFVQLAQSGTNVQIKANTSIYSGAAYRSGNQLGADMSTGSTAIGGLATSAGAAGYGISNVYMSGKVNFTGQLTYTGNTLLSNTTTSGVSPNAFSYTSRGTQEITDISSSFPAASTVINNGLVILNRSTTGAIASNLEGTEEVLQVGAPISLTGTCTHSGLTTVDLNKSLSIGSGGTTGIMTGNILNYGTVTFNRADQSTYPGVISGTGALVKTGAGELILTGLQAFTGTTTISAGKLTIERNVPAYSTSVISGAGELAIQSASASFTNAVSYPIAGIGVSSTIGGLTLGKDGNTATISIEATTSVAGPLKVYAGELALNAAISTTNMSTGDILFKMNTLSGVQSITVANSRSLTFNIAQNLVNGTNIFGSNITFIKDGAGTFTRSSVLPSGISLTTNAGVLELDMSIDAQNITLSGGTLRNKAGHTLTLNGTLSSVAGATLENNGTMTIVGPSTFPGVNTTVSAMNNLRINKQTGVTLDKDLTVTGELNLLLGNLDLGTKTLTLSGTITPTGGLLDADQGTIAFGNNTNQSITTSIFTGAIANLSKASGAGTLTLNDHFTIANELSTVASAAALVVASGKQLTVNGSLTNEGVFTLKDGATLVQATSGTSISGSGIYNVEKQLTGNAATWNSTTNEGRFWYMGVPMVNVSRSSFGTPGTTTNRLWSYNEVTKQYTDIADGNTMLSAGTGYVHRRNDNNLFTFTASGANGLYGGDLTLNGLTRTAGASAGYHLVSNPYMAYLDWAAVTKTNIEPTYYIRSSNAGNISALISCNSETQLFTSNAGVTIDEYNDVRYIAPLQAVWVRVGTSASTGSLAMSRTMLSHQTNNPGLKNNGIYPVLARVNLVDDAKYDQLLVFMNEYMSNAVDQYDSEKMFVSGSAQIYTMASGKKLVMNGLKNNKKKISVPLYLELPTSKVYQLQLNEYIMEDGLIILEDKVEGTMQDFTINDTYAFYASSGVLTNRFVLHFFMPDATITAQGPSNTWVDEDIAINEGGSILVSSNGRGKVIIEQDIDTTATEKGAVIVRDASGREVYNGQLEGAQTSIQIDAPSGVYFVEVSVQGEVAVKKIFIQQ